ncbi:hypothetical protein BU25DRAFT_416417 [Macroventuria anomochaeta]|uniref:Uncharacterized protein n=1 Tax=Macroventuria anomochaeta TaxID=301207 RepID=A0ACB6SGK9_9PLEO|nr:uncharacterized protein BU25DRAFT_416417 [Macroventuria anomochaeta]KAF2633138.1 hypothetical protein BU25DRAFT_416417 [Macroventuria anomochaeta]
MHYQFKDIYTAERYRFCQLAVRRANVSGFYSAPYNFLHSLTRFKTAAAPQRSCSRLSAVDDPLCADDLRALDDNADMSLMGFFPYGNGTTTSKESKTRIVNTMPGGGCYVNEIDWMEENWQQTFFGSNYERLAKVKRSVLAKTGVANSMYNCYGQSGREPMASIPWDLWAEGYIVRFGARS